ncbi:MAG: hypothetical protein P8077_04635, partial [Gammaproteobacteria bacterium]
YYGAIDGRDDRGSRESNYRRETCDKAVEFVSLYERKMKQNCGRDSHSTICESYKDLYRSWSGVRKSYCQTRTSKGPFR